MASFSFHCFKITFILAQALTYFIQFQYIFRILPYSNPTGNKYADLSLVVLNYVIHFTFTGLLHISHWRTYLTDPGYVKTHYFAQKIDNDNFKNNYNLALMEADDENNMSPRKKKKYEVYHMEEY